MWAIIVLFSFHIIALDIALSKHGEPSDEQMGVIEAVINNKSFQRRHLNSLYEQLKKLK